MADSLEMADLFLINAVFFFFLFKCSGLYMLWLGPAGGHTEAEKCDLTDER